MPGWIPTSGIKLAKDNIYFLVASLGKYVVTLYKLVGTLTNRACLLVQMKDCVALLPLPHQIGIRIKKI
jgi:hypothetical protein